MRVQGRKMGSYAVVLILALVVFSIAMPLYATAANEERIELRMGNIVFGGDIIENDMFQSVFHQQTLSTTDTESLGITGNEDGIDISQASDQSVAATSTGYFEANLPFYPCLNHGAPMVGIGESVAAYPVTRAKFTGNTLFFPEMVNQGNMLNNTQLIERNMMRTTLPAYSATSATGTLQGLYASQGINNSGFNARNAGQPVILSSQTIDFDACPPVINNTTIIERLWRNSHLGALLDNAYEGDTAFPSYLMPYKSPYILMEMHNPMTIVNYAMQETRPGAKLIRSMWTL